MIVEDAPQRWAARPVQAWLIRAFVFVVPVAVSILFVHLVSKIVEVPTASLPLFLFWLAVVSSGATVVLVAVERLTRRLLPLAALCNLSLVFPDAAPSRLRAAMRSNTVETLEQRIEHARTTSESSTPVESAERLLQLVAALDTHDRLTRGHSERVRAYAQLIGKEMHLSPHELDLLNWAALVHDVGKLSVPSEILTKPGKPTAEEWKVLRRHPEFGDELTASLHGWLGEWSKAVSQHHERWDGTGYPGGLEGDEIGLAARIVAVADVFDVITSARSYKTAFSSTAARDEIAKCAGTQFDPRVVRAFLNVSLGRLRLVMGPLAWLGHVSLLSRIPLTPAIGSAAASLATVAAAVTTGIVPAPAAPLVASTASGQPGGAVAERTASRDDRLSAGAGGGNESPAFTAHGGSDDLPDGAAGDEPDAAPALQEPSGSPPSSSTQQPQQDDAAPSPAGSPEPRGGSPPQARADEASVPEGGTVVVDVLANDTDPDGDRLSLLSVGAPPKGRGTKVGDRVQFEASADDPGAVVFAYAVADPAGQRASSTVSVSVLPVNDPPSFVAGGAQTVSEDAGAQLVAGWATKISPGPADEAGQAVSFLVASDDPGLFSAQPAVAADGALTFVPAANASGSATVTVRARDDGGTDRGGLDTSTPRTFTITVLPVNDPPVATADVAALDEDDTAGVSIDVLANDSAGDPGDTLTLTSYAAATIANGTLTSLGSGRFTYVPSPGFAGVETFTYDIADGGGATASATVTITVSPVEHAPVAGADAYGIQQGTSLIVAAPGVLGNDGDPDGDTIILQTALVVAPANGAAVLAANGSFTYTPSSGFAGTDTFTYRVVDTTGRPADGVVTITVASAPVARSSLYFQSSGASADIWNMTLAPPPAAPDLVDLDGDGKPGLALKNSDGAEDEDGSEKYQIWSYTPASALVLNGPVTLELWSATGNFASQKHGTLYVYLYDCTPGGASDPFWSGCTRIAANEVFASPWNTATGTWGARAITVGSLSRTIAAGHELRLRLLFSPSDLWLTLIGAYPTALVVTRG